MVQRDVEGRVRDVCAPCNYIHYRNPVPAVGVVVHINGDIVLVRRKFAPCVGHWSLPAGYMELDETTEAAAVRECAEETGLDIRIERLLGVYSFGRGADSGLVIMYAGTPIGGHLQAGDDAAEVGIFAPDVLPEPMAFTSHLQAIEEWRRSHTTHETSTLLATAPLPAHAGGWHIRAATEQDARQISDLLRLMPYGSLQDRTQALHATARFLNQVRDQSAPILVAEANGVIAGFISLSFRRALTGWRASIDDVLVAPAYRRRGVGQALVAAARQLATAHHCQVLHMDTAHASHDLQRFSQACGFADGRTALLSHN